MLSFSTGVIQLRPCLKRQIFFLITKNIEYLVWENSSNKMFLSAREIMECIKTLKIKNCEGHDRIPQRVLVDGADHLIVPLTQLFNLIYTLNQLPEQWLTAKVVLIYKKENKNDITKYRPISNLCLILNFLKNSS